MQVCVGWAMPADEMMAHGFGAMASTLLNESGKWHPDAIERALAHGDSNKVRAAYHRGAHWNERVEMAQWWSDFWKGYTTAWRLRRFLIAKPSELFPAW